ncbi:MAG TPA: hypothetical protein VFN09_03755 [Rhodanobacteraceae bacterium]|nr:hypothetical protein [Rhodanobacteraceae bacterium]
MRHRTIALLPFLAFMATAAFASGVPQDDLKEYGKGIITDYSNMQEGDDIQWYWIAPDANLAKHHCTLASFKNLAPTVDHGMRDVFKEEFPEILNHVCSDDAKAPKLHVSAAVYWAERANTARAWIPFAGGHMMQAGIGAEFVFKDASGKVLAKIRQSGREGMQLEDSARELLDDVAKFVQNH